MNIDLQRFLDRPMTLDYVKAVLGHIAAKSDTIQLYNDIKRALKKQNPNSRGVFKDNWMDLSSEEASAADREAKNPIFRGHNYFASLQFESRQSRDDVMIANQFQDFLRQLEGADYGVILRSFEANGFVKIFTGVDDEVVRGVGGSLICEILVDCKSDVDRFGEYVIPSRVGKGKRKELNLL